MVPIMDICSISAAFYRILRVLQDDTDCIRGLGDYDMICLGCTICAEWFVDE